MARQRTGTGASRLEKEKKDDANIVSIELLEGDSEKTDAEVIQYVNIHKDPGKFEDIAHVDRLGKRLRLKVKFDRPGTFRFIVKLKPDDSNAVYTEAEIYRNGNFKYSGEEPFFTNDTGEKIIEAGKIFVSPAGDDVFEITATDNNGTTVLATSKIRTKRMMYYLEAKMNGLTAVASNLSTFTDEYDKHDILFKDLPSINVSHMPNIGTIADRNTFVANIQSAYIPTKDPYCIIIGYTDHLAVKDSNQEIKALNVTGGSSSAIIIPIANINTGKKHALWNDIVPNEDWFVECYYIKDGESNEDKIAIDKSKCTPVQAPSHLVGYFNSVNVDVSTLPAEIGTITLIVNWVNRMRGGLSLTGTNIAVVCTRSWWQYKSNSYQNQVIVHEVGHQLGMVPNGLRSSKSKLDKVSSHYDHTHAGDHCYKPTGCVMYGATNGKSAFCVECIKAVKKVDLSGGV